MEVGITDHVWDLEEVVMMADTNARAISPYVASVVLSIS